MAEKMMNQDFRSSHPDLTKDSSQEQRMRKKSVDFSRDVVDPAMKRMKLARNTSGVQSWSAKQVVDGRLCR
jgi:hypothetical protein